MTPIFRNNWEKFFKNSSLKINDFFNNPFQIVFLITIYTPFEEFILKWIPLSEVLRFVPELLLYFTLVRVLGKRYFIQNKLSSTPIDLLVLLFFVSSFISVILNGSSVIRAIENLRSLWRYLSVFYILVNIDLSFKHVERITKAVHITGLMQATLASLQYFLPVNVQQFFAPREFTIGDYERVSPAEEGEVKVGAVSGTMTGPGVLSAFLLLGFVVAIGRYYGNSQIWVPKIDQMLSLFLYIFSIFATKKRAPLILMLLLPLAYLYFRKKRGVALRLTWLYLLSFFVLSFFVLIFSVNIDTSFTDTESREQSVDILSYFAQIFTSEYWEKTSQTSRGWVISTTISSVFKTGSWFGFGPDLDNLRNIVYDSLTSGFDRQKILDIGPLEDVYWMAMLAYYGIIGLGIYFLILWKLFSAGRWLSLHSSFPIYRSLGSFYCTLLFMTFFYTFIERIPKVRAFSLYFWLFSGLVMNAYNLHFQKKS